ncbi:MAG TPA: hypothetical protein VHD15_12395 [Hyphomicrobiales bacterium]|nr:hypothetical protein [Hyphomicrobiales bacterium]
MSAAVLRQILPFVGVLAFAAAAAAAPAPGAGGADVKAPPAAAAPAKGGVAMPAAANLQPVQVLLTPDLVERFIQSYPELEALSDQLDQRHPAAASGSDEEEEGPEYLLADHLSDPEDAAAIDKLLAKHGFSSYVEWANVAHSVSIAADAADSPPNDLDTQKKQALAELEADKSMNADEKAAQREEIENQFAALTEFVPLPGNVAVVKPFLSRIRALDTDSGD